MKTPIVARLALAALCTGTLASTVPAQSGDLHEDSTFFTQPRARAAAPAPLPDDDRPRLGVMVTDTPEGVYVDSVLEGSLAADAGLEEGDIILSLNGERLSDFTDIGRILGQLAPGSECTVSVIRDGQGLVKLEGRLPEKVTKKQDLPQALADGHMGGFLGVELGDATDDGVTVAGVIDGSAAWFAGLEEGDVLHSVDGTDVLTGEDVAGAVSSRAPGTLVALGYRRGDEQHSTSVRLGHRTPPLLGDLGGMQFRLPGDGGLWQHGGVLPFGFSGDDDGGPHGLFVMPRGQGTPFTWDMGQLHDHLQQQFPGVDLDTDGAHEMKIEVKDGVMTIERDGKVETYELGDGPKANGMLFKRGNPHGKLKMQVAPAPAPAPTPRVKGTAGVFGVAAPLETTTIATTPTVTCGEGSTCGGGKAVVGDGSGSGGSGNACEDAKTDCCEETPAPCEDAPAAGVN